jgi:hypothetical protein
MRAIHANFSYIVCAANLIVGVWGLVLFKRKRAATRPFWISLGGAWASIWIQGLLGLAIYDRPVKAEFKHQFYGYLFAIMTLAVFPLKGDDPRRNLIVFSIATLFIGIVAVRAIISG